MCLFLREQGSTVEAKSLFGVGCSSVIVSSSASGSSQRLSRFDAGFGSRSRLPSPRLGSSNCSRPPPPPHVPGMFRSVRRPGRDDRRDGQGQDRFGGNHHQLRVRFVPLGAPDLAALVVPVRCTQGSEQRGRTRGVAHSERIRLLRSTPGARSDDHVPGPKIELVSRKEDLNRSGPKGSDLEQVRPQGKKPSTGRFPKRAALNRSGLEESGIRQDGPQGKRPRTDGSALPKGTNVAQVRGQRQGQTDRHKKRREERGEEDRLRDGIREAQHNGTGAVLQTHKAHTATRASGAQQQEKT